MNLELDEHVTVKTKNGEFRGKVIQFDSSKRSTSVVYRVMVQIHENRNEQPLKATIRDITKGLPSAPEK